MNLQIEKKQPGLEIIRISGRIDPLTSSRLEEQLNQVIAAGSFRLIANLQEVNFISSSGLRVFLSVLKKVKAQNGDLKICCLDANVQKIFKIAGFVSLSDIVETEEEAIQKFA